MWYHEKEPGTARSIIKDENGLEVGVVITEDAPLIAAAPALLEALERVERLAMDTNADMSIIGIARAAITAAEEG